MKQLLVALLAFALIGGGIYWWMSSAKQAVVPNKMNQAGVPAANQKAGMTTKTGELSKKGSAYYLEEAGQSPKEVDSYTVELDTYVGQTVTVSGQYSGDTLFIGSIE